MKLVKRFDVAAWLGLVASAAVATSPACQTSAASASPNGAVLYSKYCALCHGSDGEGYVADRAPAIANAEFLAIATNDYLSRAIRLGRVGTTMSAWDTAHLGPLSVGDVDAIVDHLRAWQTTMSVDVSHVKVSGDASRGWAVYSLQCTSCHGPTGKEGPYMQLSNPAMLAAATDGFLQYSITHGRPATPMPSFATTLTPQQIDDVVVLLRSWQTPMPPGDVPIPGTIGPIILNATGPEPAFTLGQRFTPADVIKSELDRGAAMGFVDARAPSDYAAGHVAGAVDVPFYEVGQYRNDLPNDRWIVAYCGCPHAESGVVYDDLTTHGFTKVTIIDEGYFVWMNRGYPVHTGGAP